MEAAATAMAMAIIMAAGAIITEAAAMAMAMAMATTRTVAAAVAEADHVGPELHALLRHGEVGEVGEVGSGGRWKLRTCVFLEYCDAPLRLASGLWQAKRMCLCPS